MSPHEPCYCDCGNEIDPRVDAGLFFKFDRCSDLWHASRGRPDPPVWRETQRMHAMLIYVSASWAQHGPMFWEITHERIVEFAPVSCDEDEPEPYVYESEYDRAIVALFLYWAGRNMAPQAPEDDRSKHDSADVGPTPIIRAAGLEATDLIRLTRIIMDNRVRGLPAAPRHPFPAHYD